MFKFNCYCVINPSFYTNYLWILLIQLTILINPLSATTNIISIGDNGNNCNYTNPLTNHTSRLQCATPKVNSSDILIASGSELFGAELNDAYLAEMEKQYLSSEPFNQLVRSCHSEYSNGYPTTPIGSYEKIQEAITAIIPSIYLYIGSDTMVYRTVPGALETSRFVAQLAHESEFFTLITEYLLKMHCATKLDSAMKFPKLKVKGKLTEGQVDKFAVNSCGYRKDQLQFGCNPASKFPAYDGSCNNLIKPTLGMAYSCHRRLIPPDYGDGVKSLRLAASGQPLPNARLISNEILPSINEVDPELTQMNMQWGQFMVHDMVRTPITLGNTPECCPPSTLNHPECVTISPLPKGDSLTSIFNQTCLRNTRTSPCPRCKLGPREQLNAAPHALDLSNIYGYTYQDNLGLRSFKGGKLATALDEQGGEIMTTAEGNFDPLAIQACNVPPQFPNFICFKTGDGIRGNQHPSLTALQTIMIRRHNQHTDGLAAVNPHWSDETLFWEARRLLTAEYNHISFAEYFPTLFDPEILSYFNLNPVKSGYSKYEPETDFSTISEWATAAGRFGHSQVNDVFMVKNGPDSKSSFSFRLKDVFFEMSLIHLGQTDGIIRGLISEPAFEVDPFFIVDVKDFLYQNPNRTTGLDLLVANIMRGRDHGIPGYVNYLDYCFGFKVNDWPDLYEYIPQTQVHNLQRIYRDVRDVDLFVGGVSERRVPGNAMGPTFSCINGIQWYHSKFGDRYFYEHGGQAGSFTPEQLSNIKKTTTLARIICRTTQTGYLNREVFRLPSASGNPTVNCRDLPEIDYYLWADPHKA